MPRIDYVVDPNAFSSVEEVLALRPNSFSAKEIAFLKTMENSTAINKKETRGCESRTGQDDTRIFYWSSIDCGAVAGRTRFRV